VADSFAAALRRYRLAASLTQEALAERAVLSATAIAALERGRRRAPRLSTVRQLAAALGLDAAQLAELSRLAAPDGDPIGPTGQPAPVAPTARPVPATAAPGPSTRAWRTELVGRDEELAALEAAWARRTRLVVVGGEAGIGKTRLVGELARRVAVDAQPSAGSRGVAAGRRHGAATVAWGRCTEEGPGAYHPFVEILRRVVAATDPAQVRRAVGGRGDVLRLLPDLDRRIGPLAAPVHAEAGTEQRLLFDAVTDLLAAAGPLLVVVDDLHWADQASVALLGHLARRSGLTDTMLVATLRDPAVPAATSALLGDLARHADMTRVPLRRLGRAHLTRLVAGLAGEEIDAAVVDHIEEVTSGNPFFVEELTVALVDAGALDRPGATAGPLGDVEVPQAVRDLLAGRLAALPAAALDLALTGSVIGRDFDLAVAGAAAGLGGDRLVDAVDDLLLCGLVDDVGQGRLAFSHAIVRRAIATRLSSVRAAATHRRVAEALQARPGVPVAEIAHHWVAAAQVDPAWVSVAATWAVRAGDDALAKAAADEAIARYEQASALWETASVGHADALVRLGDALAYRGRADEADARYREALRLAGQLGDRRIAARAAIGLGRRYPYWESATERIDALETALAALGEDEPCLRVTIMGLLVTQTINGIGGQHVERRDQLAGQLAAIASDPATPDELIGALGSVRIYDCYDHPDPLNALAGRLVAFGRARNDLRMLAVAHLSQALAALDRGAMDDLRAAADRYAEVAADLDDPRERSQSATAVATIAHIEGRTADSAALSDEALRLGRDSGDYNAELVFFAQGLLRAVDAGAAAEVLPLALGADAYAHIPTFRAGTALCAALAGETELARQVVDELLGVDAASTVRGADRCAALAFLAHACVAGGLVEQAAAVAVPLAACPATAVRIGPLIGWWGPRHHHLGTLAALAGRPVEAERSLRAAVRVADTMGSPAWAARARAALARVLAGDGRGLEAEALLAAARHLAGAEAGVLAEVDRAR
jgi:transcriptional regulator with XRE-family HTH domain